ncbi:MAG: hypothetical protein ABMB14_29405 [Myxococcota bacterium]
MSFRSRLRAVVTHPATQLFVGLCMVGTGVSELVEALDGALVSSAHGVVLYGLVQTSKALIELLEGLEKVEGEPREGSAPEGPAVEHQPGK